MSRRPSTFSLFAVPFRSWSSATRQSATPDLPRQAEFLADFRGDPLLFDGGDATRWKGRRGGRRPLFRS